MQYRILHYETVDSTNNLCQTLAKDGASEGLVVRADYQTSGRGRLKRKWVSSRGKDLLFSILLRPKWKTSKTPILTMVTAEALVELLGEFHVKSKIKRPNDVLVNGKKIAGILSESSGAGERVDYVMVGIGLNVNSRDREIPKEATSIFIETGKTTDCEQLLEKFLAIFEKRYENL